MANDNLILVSGESATGKSASLMGLRNPERVMYLNCEGKKLPFNAPFKKMTITDPLQIPAAIAQAEKMDIDVIVIDSQTFMMDMYESIHVLPSSNTMQAWGGYTQFFRNLMLDTVAKSTKDVVFLAHTLSVYNEENMAMEVKVPVKGALKNNGIESFFTSIISTKKVPLKLLEKYGSDMLNITEDEEMLGFKYCYQTRLTKATVNERMRSPMGMFTIPETYTDNNLQVVLDHLHEYYK